MSISRFASLLVLLPSTAPVLAQESLAHVDAPVVTLSDQERFETLIDIENDGDMDAIGAWWIDDSFRQLRFSTYINDGSGRLAFGYNIGNPWVDQDTSSPQHALAVGDLNGDGQDDFLYAASSQVNYSLSNPDGTLSYLGNFIVAGPPLAGVAIGDFDDDGDNDIATLNETLQIWSNNGGLPNTWSSVAAVATGTGAAQLTLSEVNGDGIPDLVVTNPAQVLMYPTVAGAPGPVTALSHDSLNPMPVSGDIDGDGDLDFVVFDENDYVTFRRTGPATYTAEAETVGGPATHLSDVDGDGDLDGMCCGGCGGCPSDTWNTELSTFRLSLNDGSGAFGVSTPMPGVGAQHLAGAADLDSDGDVDVVAGRCVYYAPAPLKDGYPPQLHSEPLRDAALVDYDMDSDPDVLAGLSSAQTNLADGTLRNETPLMPTAPGPYEFVGPGYPGDWDDDGDLDLLVSMIESATGDFVVMRLMENRGGGAYRDGGNAGPIGEAFVLLNTTLLGYPTYSELSLAHDIDADGHTDLVVLPLRPGRQTQIYWNEGDGTFSVGPYWLKHRVEHLTDFDLDGLPDLVTAYHSGINSSSRSSTWPTRITTATRMSSRARRAATSRSTRTSARVASTPRRSPSVTTSSTSTRWRVEPSASTSTETTCATSSPGARATTASTRRTRPTSTCASPTTRATRSPRCR